MNAVQRHWLHGAVEPSFIPVRFLFRRRYVMNGIIYLVGLVVVVLFVLSFLGLR